MPLEDGAIPFKGEIGAGRNPGEQHSIGQQWGKTIGSEDDRDGLEHW